MAGIVEQLLELETAKHHSLLLCDPSSYEAQVRAQADLLNAGHDLRAAAHESPEQVIILSRLVRLNTALFVNFVSSSSVPLLAAAEYTSAGALDTRSPVRFSVEI
jgi:hypothetical protein